MAYLALVARRAEDLAQRLIHWGDAAARAEHRERLLALKGVLALDVEADVPEGDLRAEAETVQVL